MVVVAGGVDPLATDEQLLVLEHGPLLLRVLRPDVSGPLTRRRNEPSAVVEVSLQPS